MITNGKFEGYNFCSPFNFSHFRSHNTLFNQAVSNVGKFVERVGKNQSLHVGIHAYRDTIHNSARGWGNGYDGGDTNLIERSDVITAGNWTNGKCILLLCQLPAKGEQLSSRFSAYTRILACSFFVCYYSVLLLRFKYQLDSIERIHINSPSFGTACFVGQFFFHELSTAGYVSIFVLYVTRITSC